MVVPKPISVFRTIRTSVERSKVLTRITPPMDSSRRAGKSSSLVSVWLHLIKMPPAEVSVIIQFENPPLGNSATAGILTDKRMLSLRSIFFYLFFFFLAKPIPARPRPINARVLGSGTALIATEEVAMEKSKRYVSSSINPDP